MDDTQSEPRAAQESPTTTTEDSREGATAVLGQARLLANPRRVRRA